jgi:hypothetical protein
MSYADPIIDNLIDVLPGTTLHALLHWDDPLLSASVLLACLFIAYRDLVHLLPSLFMLGLAAAVLITGG